MDYDSENKCDITESEKTFTKEHSLVMPKWEDSNGSDDGQEDIIDDDEDNQ